MAKSLARQDLLACYSNCNLLAAGACGSHCAKANGQTDRRTDGETEKTTDSQFVKLSASCCQSFHMQISCMCLTHLPLYGMTNNSTAVCKHSTLTPIYSQQYYAVLCIFDLKKLIVVVLNILHVPER